MDREKRAREATKATAIGSVINVGLSAGKIVIGIFGRSSALVADGVHSFSDLATDIALFVGLTAYDTQKLKQIGQQLDTHPARGGLVVLGALNLYLDFINLFLLLLRASRR